MTFVNACTLQKPGQNASQRRISATSSSISLISDQFYLFTSVDEFKRGLAEADRKAATMYEAPSPSERTCLNHITNTTKFARNVAIRSIFKRTI